MRKRGASPALEEANYQEDRFREPAYGFLAGGEGLSNPGKTRPLISI